MSKLKCLDEGWDKMDNRNMNKVFIRKDAPFYPIKFEIKNGQSILDKFSSNKIKSVNEKYIDLIYRNSIVIIE